MGVDGLRCGRRLTAVRLIFSYRLLSPGLGRGFFFVPTRRYQLILKRAPARQVAWDDLSDGVLVEMIGSHVAAWLRASNNPPQAP